MLHYYIEAHITSEDTLLPDLLDEDYGEWVAVAEPIWIQPPYNEYMNAGERIAAYKTKLARAYAAVLFARIRGSERRLGYVIGYPVARDELRQISSGVNELDSLYEGVRTVYYIDAIGVSAEFDQQGIGPQLMLRIVRIAKKFGFSQCALRTSSDEMKHICDRLGFGRTGIPDGHYTDREWLARSFLAEGELVY